MCIASLIFNLKEEVAESIISLQNISQRCLILFCANFEYFQCVVISYMFFAFFRFLRFSYTPLGYKLGLIKTLIHRAFKISYNWITFHKEMELVKNYLGKNAYPPSIVDKEIKTYINKIHTKKNAESEKKQKTYMKLRYIGKCSKFTQNKIKHLCDIFYKETRISLVFSSTKVASFFQIKDKIPSALKSFVVYKFTCANCNVSYAGETCRHLDVRIEEHFKSASSHIHKHLSNQHARKAACDKSCFQIIDSATSSFRLKIKEAIHIN